MTQTDTEKMIDRYVRKGGNAETGREILADLLRRHDGINLAYALVYWDFATQAQAARYVGVSA